jgi:hypothetical protein
MVPVSASFVGANTTVAVGAQHTCALRSLLGTNEDAQLGHGTLTWRFVPTAVTF